MVECEPVPKLSFKGNEWTWDSRERRLAMARMALTAGSRYGESIRERSIMSDPFSKDPLHGVTLEKIVTTLAEELGWEDLGRRVKVRCFLFEPSVSSSLKFLRRTPWARAEVERLYVDYVRYKASREYSPDSSR